MIAEILTKALCYPFDENLNGLEAIVKLEFKHLSKKALGEWTESSKNKPDIEVLGPVVVGWSDVFDCNGEPVPFSHEAFAQLLGDYSPAAREIFLAYVLALTESRSKN